MEDQQGIVSGTEPAPEDALVSDSAKLTTAAEPLVAPIKKDAAKQSRRGAKGIKLTAETPKTVHTPVPAPNTKPEKQSKSAPAPWTFPKNSLEDTLGVVRAIEEQNGGNPMKSDELVKAVGFNTVNDWRYLELLRSANQYGIVEGSGRHATVKLTDIGQDIVAPSSPKARQNALVRAFHSVDQFSKVEQFYSGKKLPEDEFFEIL